MQYAVVEGQREVEVVLRKVVVYILGHGEIDEVAVFCLHVAQDDGVAVLNDKLYEHLFHLGGLFVDGVQSYGFC